MKIKEIAGVWVVFCSINLLVLYLIFDRILFIPAALGAMIGALMGEFREREQQ